METHRPTHSYQKIEEQGIKEWERITEEQGNIYQFMQSPKYEQEFIGTSSFMLFFKSVCLCVAPSLSQALV